MEYILPGVIVIAVCTGALVWIQIKRYEKRRREEAESNKIIEGYPISRPSKKKSDDGVDDVVLLQALSTPTSDHYVIRKSSKSANDSIDFDLDLD